MAKNKPKNQHIVPKCYLREWVDPNTPNNQEPYLWVFGKDDRHGKKKAPINLFVETDFFTVESKNGEKDYFIEETLAGLEGQYATVFRNKIKNHLPLTFEEHVILCAFVAAMLQRTRRHKASIDKFHDDLISKVSAMEAHHNLEPKKSEELKNQKINAHRLSILSQLPELVKVLMKMNLAFLCSDKRSKFITSDDPCNLFNPDLQWQKFYGPGLGQKNVQVTMPLSPKIKLCMSWSNLSGYINFDRSEVQNSNRMIRAQCHEFFVSDSPKTRRSWFRAYPLDIPFIIKILKHKVTDFIFKIKFRNGRKR